MGKKCQAAIIQLWIAKLHENEKPHYEPKLEKNAPSISPQFYFNIYYNYLRKLQFETIERDD